MNKRDKFAMAAMQALISKSGFQSGLTEEEADRFTRNIVKGSYAYADAMLEVSEQGSSFTGDSSFDKEDFLKEVGDYWKAKEAADKQHRNHMHETVGPLLMREHPCKGGCEACVGCNAAESNYEAEDNTTFKPFNIQVKTKGQAELIASLLGGCHLKIDNEFGVNTYAMYKPISEYSRMNVKLIELNN